MLRCPVRWPRTILAWLVIVLAAAGCTSPPDSDGEIDIVAFQSAPVEGQAGVYRLSWQVQGLAGGRLMLRPGADGAASQDVTDLTFSGVGGVDVQPTSSTTYTLEARSDQATVERDLTIEIADGGPVISSLQVDQGGASEAANEGVDVDATLTWSVEDADWVHLIGPGLPQEGEDVSNLASFDVTAPAGASFTLRAGNEAATSEMSATLAARPVPAATFLIAGQSNASGRNLSRAAAMDFITADPGVRMLGNDEAWKGAYEPLDDKVGQLDDDPSKENGDPGVSMGVSLGNHVAAATGGTTFLIPAPLGGSPIDKWLPPSDRDDRSSLYGNANVRGAMAASQRRAPLGYELDGRRYGALVWYQGESDTDSVDETNAYVDKTSTVLDAFGADLGTPAILVQLSRVQVEEPERNELYQRVREFQRSMAADARTADGGTAPNAEAGRYLVVTHDLPLGDALHLDKDAQVELGRRVSLAFREHLLGEDVDGTGPRLQGIDVTDSVVRVRTDRPITAPATNGPNAYGGYFSVYDDGEPAEIAEIVRDPSDETAVRISLQSPRSGTVTVAYMPPEGGQASVATDVVRSAACGDPMPSPHGVCLPMPAFGLTPQESLQGLRLRALEDE